MGPKRNRKKLLLVLLIPVVAAAAAAVIWLKAGTGGEIVNVYPFQYVGMTEYWGDSQESYGPVTTDKIQTVFLSNTQTVTEILVEIGDSVKKGDILMTFDTTLDSLAVERKGLEVEKLKLKLKNLKHQLEEVKKMNPYIPVYVAPGKGDPLGVDDYKFAPIYCDGSNQFEPIYCWLNNTMQIDYQLMNEILNEAYLRQHKNQQNPPSSASAVPESMPGETIPQITLPPETVPQTTVPQETIPQETVPQETVPQETVPQETVPQETIPQETIPQETVPQETTPQKTIPQVTETLPEEEEILGEEASGNDTNLTPEGNEDVSCYVVLRMSEDNMSGGKILMWQGMHLTRKNGRVFFVFFEADGLLDPWAVETQTPGSIMGSGYTKQQLAQMQSDLAKEIKETEFNIRMAEAEYKLMQIEVSDGNVYAQIDGEILSVITEEEAKSGLLPLIKLSGGGGFYVQGSINELEKDKLKPGQEVTINDWNTGMTYTGEVKSIGDFPLTGDNWTGMGNPNASYYPFRVFISGEADLQEGSYVSVMYSAAQAESGVYLQTPFVRTENGQSYVFVMNEKGKLEKRTVRVGKSLWGSYLEILEGVSEDDLVAFPYGKTVKDGANAAEGDLNTLYGY